MHRTTARSGAADRAERLGQHRSWRSATVLLGGALLLTGCGAGGQVTGPGPSAATETTETAGGTAAEDGEGRALEASCTRFWGDPDYVDPLSRTVLDRAGTAEVAGPSDPFFYSMTGDDIDAAFEDAPAAAQDAAEALAEWFRTEPERGAEADAEAFRGAWEDVAAQCQDLSPAALWALGEGAEGTKPAALVCADVFDTPGTLTHFANANVLTSNMFKLVGLSPRTVPADRGEDVAATDELLTAEIDAVDDDAVRAALEDVRSPFRNALEGESWSEGLREPLTELGTACEAVGYSSPGLGDLDNSAVVGAGAAPEGGHTQEGRS